MYTLEDITVFDLIYRKDTLSAELKTVLSEYKISNCKELEHQVNSSNHDFQQQEFYDILDRAIHTLSLIDKSQILTSTYQFETYRESGYDLNFLNAIDKHTKGDVLIVHPMMSIMKSLSSELGKLDIYTLKYLLDHIAITGENALVKTIYGLGRNKLMQVLTAIPFYEKQVLRLAASTEDLSQTEDIFLKDKKEKVALVKEYYDSIVSYLYSNATVFIWGPRGKNAEFILKSIPYIYSYKRSVQACYKQSKQEQFIDTIANYTTLDELKDEKTRKKALDRFIVK